MATRSMPLVFLRIVAVAAAVVACRGAPEPGRPVSLASPSLVGRLLLPAGSGSRGVELLVTTRQADERLTWVLFDEQGRFEHGLEGQLVSVVVTAGAEVHRLDGEALPEVDAAGRVDLGALDLRDELVEQRLLVRAGEGLPAGDVRVGLFDGPPPVGPFGEPVSLGSRQFPDVALGSELAWLLPRRAQGVHFLVERPLGPGRGREWRSGRQTLFGPFSVADLPTELVVE